MGKADAAFSRSAEIFDTTIRRVAVYGQDEWDVHEKLGSHLSERLMAQGARVLGNGEPKIGAHGKPVLFLHPKDFCGTLVELEQA